jgi:SAM-dependent MidA family methyltransferase
VTSLEQVVVDAARREGPLPFSRYVELALYHPDFGYYTVGRARTGPHGHFLTSPELDPVYGELWTRGFEIVWEMCERPDRFDVIEIGPGEAGLCAAVLDAAQPPFANALRITLVERDPKTRKRQEELLAHDDRVTWASSTADVRVACGCVFANEVLDNVPVDLVEQRGDRLMELRVDESLSFVAVPARPELRVWLERCEMKLADGGRAEVCLGLDDFVREASQTVDRGALLMVDYGDDADALADRTGGTLLCYSDAGIDDLPLDRPGAKDITAHVNLTALAEAIRRAGFAVHGPARQRDVMRALGLRDLDARLRAEAGHATGRGDGRAAVRAISRRGALSTLTEPAGLGGQAVMAGTKGIARPPFVP